MQQCSFDLERVHQNGLRLGTWGPSVKWVESQRTKELETFLDIGNVPHEVTFFKKSTEEYQWQDIKKLGAKRKICTLSFQGYNIIFCC